MKIFDLKLSYQFIDTYTTSFQSSDDLPHIVLYYCMITSKKILPMVAIWYKTRAYFRTQNWAYGLISIITVRQKSMRYAGLMRCKIKF
jgi:hypothetical protein